MVNLFQVAFDSSDPAEYVGINFKPGEGLVRFDRDLLYSDAPEPGFDLCPN